MTDTETLAWPAEIDTIPWACTPERFISGDCDNVNKIVGKGKGRGGARGGDRHGITGPRENVNAKRASPSSGASDIPEVPQQRRRPSGTDQTLVRAVLPTVSPNAMDGARTWTRSCHLGRFRKEAGADPDDFSSHRLQEVKALRADWPSWYDPPLSSASIRRPAPVRYARISFRTAWAVNRNARRAAAVQP